MLTGFMHPVNLGLGRTAMPTRIYYEKLRFENTPDGHVHYVEHQHRGRRLTPDSVARQVWHHHHKYLPDTLVRTCDDAQCVALEHHTRYRVNEPMSEKYRDSMMRMHRDGYKRRDIAEAHGMSRSWAGQLIRKWSKEHDNA
jgi:hypothetical protein